MDIYPLQSLTIKQGDWSVALDMESAQLVLVTEAGSRLWYVDVNGISNSEVLDYFYTASDIQITLHAVSETGQELEGIAYFHANKAHQAAALRGDGELLGI